MYEHVPLRPRGVEQVCPTLVSASLKRIFYFTKKNNIVEIQGVFCQSDFT